MNRPVTRGEDFALTLATVGIGVVLTAAVLVWLSGQLAALALHQAWPPTPVAQSLEILLRLPTHLSHPADAWPAPARMLIPAAPAVYAAMTLMLAGIGSAFAWVLTRWPQLRQRQRKIEQDASYAWAQPAQVPHLLTDGRDPHRVALGTLAGRTVAAERRRSVLVVAPTQAGKTTRFVIPTVARWRGPLVIATVKTDVLRPTYRHRSAVTDGRALVFDPTGVVDAAGDIPTARWSPLLTAGTYPEAERTARWLLKAAATESPDVNGKFWENTAGKLLAPLLYAAANSSGDLGTIGYWLDTKETDEIDQILRHLRDPDALNAWTASSGRESRTRDSAYASCESLMTAFTTPAVRTATTTSDDAPLVDPSRILDEQQTLYLVGSADDQEVLAPLFIALLQSILREAQRRYNVTATPLDPPLMLMLDEAAHVAPLPNLPTLAATGAGQGIQVVSVWQDLSQVEEVYGRRARTVVNNHTARVFLPGSADDMTLDRVSRTVGDHRVDRDSQSVDESGRRSRTRSHQDVRLAPPDYVRTLPEDAALVLYGRDPALKVATRAWFYDPRLSRALGPPKRGGQPAAPPAPRHPQDDRSPLPVPPTRASTGSPSTQSEASMNENRPAGAGTSLQSVPGPAHSTLERLTADPGSPGYAVDDAGRRYFLTHAADGSTVPIPVELTDEQRAELDAARDRANAFADQLRFDDGIADVVPLHPHEPDAGDL